VKKFFLWLLFLLACFFLFFSEAQAAKSYYPGIKRRLKSYYYQLQRKPKPTVKLKTQFHRQEHSLSCEVAALKMALSVKGMNPSESELIRQLPWQPMWGNPHQGFVGDINGGMLKTGYGVYWKPIAKIAQRYRPAEAFEHWSVQRLASEIQRGNPVVVWGYVGSGKRRFWRAPDGTPIWGVSGEHARTVIGFAGSVTNPQGFFLLDPIYGEIYWNTKSLQSNWAPFGNAGVVIR